MKMGNFVSAMKMPGVQLQERIQKLSSSLEELSDGNWREIGKRVRTCGIVTGQGPVRWCSMSFCPRCQWTRSLLWRTQFFDTLLPSLFAHHNRSLRFYFLCLPVGSFPIRGLRKQIFDCTDSWQRLAQLRVFPRGGYARRVRLVADD